MTPSFDKPLTACSLCGSSDIRHYVTDFQHKAIFQCEHCGVQFMNPQYTDDYLTELYSTYQNADNKHHRYLDDDVPRFAKHHHNFELIERHGIIGRLLSVGSGNGIDLLVAKDRGWKASGYEVDQAFAKLLAVKTDTKIYTNDFPTLKLDGLFDCVYLNHVIEHPKNPGEYLSKINTIMPTGGLLYLATPNIRSISIMYKKTLDFLRLRKKKASYYDTWQHLTYFNPRQLSSILQNQFGFETLLILSDNKTMYDGKIQSSRIDTLTLKSSFRLLARKVKPV